MGAGISGPVTQNMNNLHSQLMSQAGADYDIATTTTLSYSQFLSYITELNKICARYSDAQNCVLVFAVKKGSDATLFWKATVRVACVKLDTERNQVESHRLLNIRQFLQVFRRISYECTKEAVEPAPSEEEAAANTSPPSLPPTLAASMVLGEAPPSSSKGGGGDCLMEDCIICLERRPEVILPCCHAFCTPCIEQWLEYCRSPLSEDDFPRSLLQEGDLSEKSCPVCRQYVESAEEGWVISEAPDRGDVDREIRRALISYATTSSSEGNRAPSSSFSVTGRES